ncbi:MAG: T9SS type A sorting domain-containing protein [Flavobacteriales bacterium]|nr:T9SS type A sorting domain-containing protein [Flavobacteriales bacterium]
MKKAKLLFSTLLLISIHISAQDSAYLDIGNVRALIHSDGNLFQNRATGQASFEVPKGSNSHSIYSSFLWLSSESVRNGERHISLSKGDYNQTNFKIGPVDIVNQAPDSSSSFQRLWKVDRTEIDHHIQNWNNPGYRAPASILDWPGNGNANTAQNLAPYKDLDNDNIYEPLDGEYPIIKGDQAVLLILNDYRPEIVVEQLQLPPAPPIFLYNWGGLKIEMHILLYAFDSPNPAINNAIFSNVKIFNRSNSTIDNHSDFRFSVFADFDLGGASDDYIGTDSTNNLFYSYNGSLFDNGQGGQSGYGNKLAAQGVQFLDYDIDHSVYYNVGSGANGDPNFPEHHLGYQRGFWKNGQAMYFGGNGFDYCVDTTHTTKLILSGDPTLVNDTTQWTEINPCLNSTPSINSPGDRRMIGGPKAPKQLNIGDVIEINYAYVFVRDNDTSTVIGQPLTRLFSTTDSVKNFFDNTIVTGIQATASSEVEFNLSPNPANQMLNVNLNESDFEITIFDITGSEVKFYRNIKSIDVSGFSNGIYFFQVRTATQMGTKKLIVTH